MKGHFNAEGSEIQGYGWQHTDVFVFACKPDRGFGSLVLYRYRIGSFFGFGSLAWSTNDYFLPELFLLKTKTLVARVGTFDY